MARALTDEQNERVRAALKSLRPRFKNQTELGRAVGVDQSTISALLRTNSDRGTTYDVAVKVAGLLNVRVNDLLGVVEVAVPAAAADATELDPAHPNRAIACAYVGAQPSPDHPDRLRQAIEDVRAMRLSATSDPPVDWWIDRIRARYAELRDPWAAPPGMPPTDPRL